MSGTFARVWLVRLKGASGVDENKVFALKILRKVDGTERLLRVNHVQQLTPALQ
jgi:protein kinase A